MSRVIFLDYDGVVNTPMWNEKGTRCGYGFPSDNKVNNFQAVQWISEFCEKHHYGIVVTSTWRLHQNWKECLVNGGLRESVQILGRTNEIQTEDYYHDRGREVDDYLKQHPEIKYYLIVDDENSFFEHHQLHFIQTRDDIGFTEFDFKKAEKIANRDRGHGNSFWVNQQKI